MRAHFGALLQHHDREFRLTCFSRIAAASPAGPAPTITTSNSMLSRSGSSCCSVITLSSFAGLLPAPFPAKSSRHDKCRKPCRAGMRQTVSAFAHEFMSLLCYWNVNVNSLPRMWQSAACFCSARMRGGPPHPASRITDKTETIMASALGLDFGRPIPYWRRPKAHRRAPSSWKARPEDRTRRGRPCLS